MWKFGAVWILVLFYNMFQNSFIQTHGADITCDKAYQCHDTILTGGQLDCEGFRSCSLATMSSTSRARCKGGYSCVNASISASVEIVCHGDHACGSSEIDSWSTGRGEVFCSGTHGCVSSLISGFLVKCQGVYSCVSSVIENGWKVEFLGAFAGMHTTIDATGDHGNITVQFEGYLAGYNATVQCYGGYYCKIICHGNGCFNLNYICLNNATQDCDWVIECDPKNETYCPNGYNGGADYSNNSSINTVANNLFLNLSTFVKTDSVTANKICQANNTVTSSGKNMIVCQDRNECEVSTGADLNKGNVNQSICCGGEHSCDGHGLIQISGQDSNIIDCVGKDACYESTISTTISKTITTTTTTDDIYNYTNIKWGDGILRCSGKQGCDKTSIFNFNIVECTGMSSCTSCRVENISTMILSGVRAAMNSNFTDVNNLYVAASKSLDGSVIIYNNVSMSANNYIARNLYLMAPLASEVLQVTCGHGNACKLYCVVSRSCKNVFLTCLSGSKCVVHCPFDVHCPVTNAPNGTVTYITPTSIPTMAPSTAPSTIPTIAPTLTPTAIPTTQPTTVPTIAPSISPSIAPSTSPSVAPSTIPTTMPTIIPSIAPSITPSTIPTTTPTTQPTTVPTNAPSMSPSIAPSTIPTATPTMTPSTQPSIAPSTIPTIIPTINPSIAPSIAPSAIPSTMPTTTPTMIPSIAPSIAPSTIPSTAPTVTPSTQPSIAPSTPTIIPSTQPTPPPLSVPLEPTPIPTTSIPNTTNASTVNTETIANVQAQFSYDFLQIIIEIEVYVDFIDNDEVGAAIEASVIPIALDCEDIFTNETFALLSTYSSCEWNINSNSNSKIIVTLSGFSSIEINSLLNIKTNSFMIEYFDGNNVIQQFLTSNNNSNGTDGVISTSISLPDKDEQISPVLVVSDLHPVIGICNDLTLDARNSYNLGGRSAIFEWCLVVNNNTNIYNDTNINSQEIDCVYGKQATITNDWILENLISFSEYKYTIIATVYTWYESNDSFIFNIEYRDSIIPLATIDGPLTFAKDDPNYLNNHITFYAELTIFSNITCLQKVYNTSRTKVAEWLQTWENTTVEWSVSVASNNKHNSSDSAVYANHVNISSLNRHLHDLRKDQDAVTLSVIDYDLKPGFRYDFMASFLCDTCDEGAGDTINVTHSIDYQYSDLVCQIAGGNKEIVNVSLNSIKDEIFELNGELFTYDPDAATIYNKSHLAFEWSCIERIVWNNSNDYGANYTDLSFANGSIETKISDWSGWLLADHDEYDHIRYFSLNQPLSKIIETQIESQNSTIAGYIEYEFELNVYDTRTTNRESCVAFKKITISDIRLDSKNEMKLLDISISAIKSNINSDERVRLISTIDFSDNILHNSDNYNYTWTESNGHLTQDDIKSIQINKHNNYNAFNQERFNLILDANSLQSDTEYEFHLSVENKYNKYEFGSASVNVYVNEKPSIVDGSFTITPNCQSIVIDDITQLFDYTFDISIEANGDNTPLLYQFSYTMANSSETILLHPFLLSHAYLDNTILPVGSFFVQVAVFDSNGASTTVTADEICHIETKFGTDNSNVNHNGVNMHPNECRELVNLITNDFVPNRHNSSFVPFVSKYKQYVSYFQSIDAVIEYIKIGHDCQSASVSDAILKSLNKKFVSGNEMNFCDNDGEYVIPLAQTITLFLELQLHQSLYNLTTLQTEIISYLLSQVLDPCGVINSAFIETDIIVVVDSVITATPKLINKTNGEDVTDEFSSLLTNLRNINVLDNLMYTAIWYWDKYENDNLMQLFDNSLYISELVRISISIPSEHNRKAVFSQELNVPILETYSIRADNETIDEHFFNNSVSVALDSSDTSDARSAFADYYTNLQSVDVIIVAINSQCNIINDIDYNYNNSIQSQSNGTPVTSTVSIKILSQGSQFIHQGEIYPLQANMSLIFDEPCHDTPETFHFICVWFNNSNDSWSSDGCITKTTYTILGGNIIECSCNHLTTFAVLYHIDEQEGESVLIKTYSMHPGYAIGSLVLILGYGIVFLFIVRLFYRAHSNGVEFFFFCKKKSSKKKKHSKRSKDKKQYETAFGALLFTMIQCILQVFSGLIFLTFVVFFKDFHDESADRFTDSQVIASFYKEFLTFSLILPLLVSMYIFSHLIYGMALVTVSTSVRIQKKKRQINKFTIASNAVITAIFVIIIIFLVFDLNKSRYFQILRLFLVFECLYIIIMFVVGIFIGIFGYQSSKIVHDSIVMLDSQSSRSQTCTEESISVKLQKSIKNSLSNIRRGEKDGNKNQTPPRPPLTLSSETNSNRSVGDHDHDRNRANSNQARQRMVRRRAFCRIMFGAVFSGTFLIVQTILSIYFMIHPDTFTAIFHVFDVFINLLLCITVVGLYRHYVESKINDKIALGMYTQRLQLNCFIIFHCFLLFLVFVCFFVFCFFFAMVKKTNYVLV